MSLLIRKVEKGKWKPNTSPTLANVSSDAITQDLATKGNSLSVWEFNLNDENEVVDEGILALVTNEQQKHIESIDVAVLDIRELEEKSFQVMEKEGLTFVDDLIHTHRDISNLTYSKLGIMAEIILHSFKNNRVIRRPKSEIIKIVIKAIKQGRLDFSRLHDNIKKTIMDYCQYHKVDFGND